MAPHQPRIAPLQSLPSQTPREQPVAKSEPPPHVADADLWQALRQWRIEKAREKKVSAFIILYNSGLDELCEKMPCTLEDLRGLPKFGPKKTGLYGDEILQILAQYRNTSVPT